MSNLKTAYSLFWKGLTDEQRQLLSEQSNFDPERPWYGEPPKPHRYFYNDASHDPEEANHEDQGGIFGTREYPQYDINHREYIRWQAGREMNADNIAIRVYTHEEVLDVIRRICLAFDCTHDAEAKLHGTCIKIAVGIYDPPSQTALAKLNGVNRANISYRVKRIQETMGLPPSMYMKSEEACEKLSDAIRKPSKKKK